MCAFPCTCRKDSDLNGVVDVRYTGGARMLLALEVGEGRWRFKVPVLVSDLDVECALWLKVGVVTPVPITPMECFQSICSKPI